MTGAAPLEVENQENRLPDCVIFILRQKFDLFEIFVIYLFGLCFCCSGRMKDPVKRGGSDEKQQRTDIRSRVWHALSISEKMQFL
ncbi:hypothetical protein [Janthinobacterium sp. JC611]|uniref:hypothetical protein n=1 Tax=Janthinobacterium sp. JC611 TaxID=2816201 RepID=UPI001BFE6D77|nr:hypothetical protein [Janthinobacterium sp. JC611]